MKKFTFEEASKEDFRVFEVIIGTSREIRSLWNRLDERSSLGFCTLWQERPKFNDGRMYGLTIVTDAYGRHWFQVVNASTIVGYLTDPDIRILSPRSE